MPPGIWRPASALTGRLAGDVDVRGSALNARADLDLKFNGTGELRNVTARFPLDPAFVAQFPRDQRGNIVADLKRVVLTDGPALAQLQGTIELHELRQVGANPLELGSYRRDLRRHDRRRMATSVGQLRDIGGPFAVEGHADLTPPNGYVVQGYITGRTRRGGTPGARNHARRATRRVRVAARSASKALTS